MPLILNIETATDICSVCIAREEVILSVQEAKEAYSHAAVITILIEACFKEAGLSLNDLDAVAISSGPGSYTALRVGAAAAKGICYALDKPLIAVNTLEALAYAAQKDKGQGLFYIPMIDARRMEVYTAVYDQSINQIKKTHNLILDQDSLAEYFEQDGTLVFCGNGALKTKPLFESKNVLYSNVICAAQHLIPFSVKAFHNQIFSDIAYYSPSYFKAPNITVSKKIL
ncbi:MAG: tRNA threonylcarbamoyladenosine biosynthesis protein TsaB [Saprospiraceae bacterium]|jgi:tRNA threonylcarbamoyladenosine biosynthesis protein TsaB